MELIPNLMLPDQETFPTSEDADELQRALFVANSKFMELINLQTEFEGKEQEGLQANQRVEAGLKNMMFIELVIIIAIGLVQYLVMRRFVNKIKRM